MPRPWLKTRDVPDCFAEDLELRMRREIAHRTALVMKCPDKNPSPEFVQLQKRAQAESPPSDVDLIAAARKITDLDVERWTDMVPAAAAASGAGTAGR